MRRAQHLLAACAAAFSVSAASAADFGETVFFGNSLTDSGTALGAKSTTNPAPVWSELLAGRLGTAAAPFFFAGGSNFAVGGARVTESTAGIPPAIVDQISVYLATTGGRASGAALYTVWAGANDVFAGAGVQPAADLAAQIERLRTAGARFLLVPNVPDLGLTPNAIASGTTASLAQASAQFNQALYSAIAARGLRVIAMDTFTLLREVTADPGAYGFVDVTSRACGATPGLLCGPDDLVTPGADQTFLFADDRHPTAAGHALLADYASSILAAPGQISMLAETALAMRSAHVERLFLRFEEPGRGRGLWITLDGRRVAVESDGIASDAEGYGGGLTVGADLVGGSRWFLGAALGFGRVKPDFGNGGHFAQDEAVVSLYGGWRSGPWRVGGVLSYGALDHEVDRDIRLVAATRTASGSPGARNVSLGLEAGYRFTTARLTHGPIAGVLLQQARVDAFTEARRRLRRPSLWRAEAQFGNRAARMDARL
jgi:outer membrane lipase/esterase